MDSQILVMHKHSKGWQRKLVSIEGKQTESTAAKLAVTSARSMLASTSTGLIVHASSAEKGLLALDTNGDRKFELQLEEK